MADGDGPLEGESSGSTFCRGEIREWGDELDLGEAEDFGDGDGEAEGFGEAVTLGAVVGLGDDCGAGVEEKRVVPLFRFTFQVNTELLASAFSMLATVTTSPPLNGPRVLLVGIVAVGGWPTGMGS